jgi:hypothetical protein
MEDLKEAEYFYNITIDETEESNTPEFLIL